jgi:hypothetical protein
MPRVAPCSQDLHHEPSRAGRQVISQQVFLNTSQRILKDHSSIIVWWGCWRVQGNEGMYIGWAAGNALVVKRHIKALPWAGTL